MPYQEQKKTRSEWMLMGKMQFVDVTQWGLALTFWGRERLHFRAIRSLTLATRSSTSKQRASCTRNSQMYVVWVRDGRVVLYRTSVFPSWQSYSIWSRLRTQSVLAITFFARIWLAFRIKYIVAANADGLGFAGVWWTYSNYSKRTQNLVLHKGRVYFI